VQSILLFAKNDFSVLARLYGVLADFSRESIITAGVVTIAFSNLASLVVTSELYTLFIVQWSQPN